jgi:hypothetical protein
VRQLAKINGMTAARAADRNRHVLFAGLIGRRIPQP